MSFINFFKNVIRAKKKEKKQVLRNFICLFFILVFLLNFLFIIDNNYQNYCSYNEDNVLKKEIGAKNLDSLKLSQSPDELLLDPFTINFNDMWIFFNTYFKSNLNYDIDLYVSESKSDGVIIDNTTNSRDNLLLYKSLRKEDYNEETTFEAYLDLQSTPLWYQGNISQFKYGFVKSINGSTGEIKDDTRYLVDNLMPIFLLIENIDDNNITETYKDSIIEMFNLINSSEFWDRSEKGFYESNSSTNGEKYMKSNLYAVLANLLIHRYEKVINNNSVTERASALADNTMKSLIYKAWNNDEKGFYNSTDSNWISVSGTGQQCLYLDVNALGIIALLEYWLKTGNSEYFENATALYNQLSEDAIDDNYGGLWNETRGAYEYYRSYNWENYPNTESKKLDIEANALMMQACLKLFEVTGNFSYYKRAFKLRDFIEKYLYNNSINAYMTSIDTFPPFTNNTNVNFHKNLKLCEAYLKALEIYNSVLLDASYDSGSDIDFTMNQDSINLTCTYAFEKDISYFFNGEVIDTIRYDNITGASVTYIFRYPNGTIIVIITDTFINSTTNLIYPINSSLPFGDGYTITVYANWTYFGFKSTTKNFNVKPGLRIDWESDKTTLKQTYYQGEVANFSIVVNSSYNNDLTLNVSMIGNVIKEDPSFPINITFVNISNNDGITIVDLNITILDDAPTGKANLTFIFKGNSTIYLKELKEIDIKNALTYSNLIYSKKVVPGNSVNGFVDVINQSPNVTQNLDLSFSGTYCSAKPKPITLRKNKRKTVSFLIVTDSIIPTSSIEIDMTISIGKEILYTEILTVEIVPSFEIISIEFPEKVTQGTNAYLVIFIQNNKLQSEDFSLYVNDEKVKPEIDELIPGENRIEYKFVPTWFPYEFGIKSCHIEIEDDSDNVIVEDYFEYEIELSAMNLIIFYVVPIVVPIGIILHYKSKYLKHKLLRR